MQLFDSLPLHWTVIVFLAMATITWMTGTRLSYLADAIGHRTGISRAIMGLLFLAAITELPELVTTFYSSWKGNAALALNNMFGGIVMQTAVLAVADAFVLHLAISALPRKTTPILEGMLLIVMLSALLVVTMVGEIALFGYAGLGAIILAAVYVTSVLLLRRVDKSQNWKPIDLPNPDQLKTKTKNRDFRNTSARTQALYSILAICVILICGTLLVESAEAIAVQTFLGNSFVGVTLLAAATSLPELSTTITAVRIGAYTMAISNILGSNLIMILLILPADLLYRSGPILDQADDTARVALGFGVLVTAIYLVGLLVRKKPRIMGMGVDSLVVLVVYAISLVTLFQVSR